jgi:hypothetical protein
MAVLPLHAKFIDTIYSLRKFLQSRGASAALPINNVHTVIGATSNWVQNNDIVDPEFVLTAMLQTPLQQIHDMPSLELQPPVVIRPKPALQMRVSHEP